MMRIDEIVQAAFVGILVLVFVRLCDGGTSEQTQTQAQTQAQPQAQAPAKRMQSLRYVGMFIVTFVTVCAMLRAFRAPLLAPALTDPAPVASAAAKWAPFTKWLPSTKWWQGNGKGNGGSIGDAAPFATRGVGTAALTAPLAPFVDKVLFDQVIAYMDTSDANF
jgi:hypothetical protein